MENQTLFWLALTLLCIIVEAFYAMGEIAIISFNKVRLQYYLNKNNNRAKWIFKLLQNPANLFGTFLLGVNIALQVGSECSRQFYESAGLDPDYAPFTQFILVVIIAELAPLFAGRRYAEHVAMLQAPFIYASSIILSPLIIFFRLAVKLVNKIFHAQEEELSGILSRDELQKIVEEHDDRVSKTGENEEFNRVVANLFVLRSKTVKEVMINLQNLKMVSASLTVKEFRDFIKTTNHSRIPVYHNSENNIVGIAQVRDLLKLSDESLLKGSLKSPWFITQDANIIQILDEFRRNNQEMAICLDSKGKSVGMLTLEDILDEVFHKDTLKVLPAVHTIIERHFPGSLKVRDFNKEFHTRLEDSGDDTLEDVVVRHLEHHPEVGDSVRCGRLEITVEEVSFLAIKMLSVKTII
jgi:putative hemolysin